MDPRLQHGSRMQALWHLVETSKGKRELKSALGGWWDARHCRQESWQLAVLKSLTHVADKLRWHETTLWLARCCQPPFQQESQCIDISMGMVLAREPELETCRIQASEFPPSRNMQAYIIQNIELRPSRRIKGAGAERICSSTSRILGWSNTWIKMQENTYCRTRQILTQVSMQSGITPKHKLHCGFLNVDWSISVSSYGTKRCTSGSRASPLAAALALRSLSSTLAWRSQCSNKPIHPHNIQFIRGSKGAARGGGSSQGTRWDQRHSQGGQANCYTSPSHPLVRRYLMLGHTPRLPHVKASGSKGVHHWRSAGSPWQGKMGTWIKSTSPWK